MKSTIACAAFAVACLGASSLAKATGLPDKVPLLIRDDKPTPGYEPDPLARVRQLAENKIDPRGRVVGGKRTSIDEHPWQVALLDTKAAVSLDAQFCGGSYLGGGWILTAAHCLVSVSKNEDFVIVAGATVINGKSKTIKVENYVSHPDFSPTTLNNDLALVKVKTEDIDGLAKLVKLPSSDQPGKAVPITISGWGRIAERDIKSDVLMEAVVYHQPRTAVCNAGDALDGQVTDNMFCAGDKNLTVDSCTGDSGGPATTTVNNKPVLAGVISWGVGCGRGKRYGVYTKVSNYLPWIKEKSGISASA